jgi:hypothetical protein
VLGDGALEDRDLAVEEVDLAQAPVDGLALVIGQRERGQPRAAASPECVAHRRAALEGAHQHRVDLVLGTGALSDELRAAGQAPAQRPRRLIRQPAAAQQPGGEKPRQRARVAAVGLDLRLGDPRSSVRVATTTRATCASNARAIASALPLASSAT